MTSKTYIRLILSTILLLVAPLASAHPGHLITGGLIDGFMHPATGLDHLLVALAAGYWAARRGDHGLRGQALFMSLFAAGILLGAAGTRLFQVDVTPALMAVLIGVVVTVAIGATRWFWHALFGGLALFQGAEHLSELPADSAVTGFAIGLLLSTGVLVAIGQMIRHVVHTRRPHST